MVLIKILILHQTEAVVKKSIDANPNLSSRRTDYKLILNLLPYGIEKKLNFTQKILKNLNI